MFSSLDDKKESRLNAMKQILNLKDLTDKVFTECFGYKDEFRTS